MKFLGNSVKYMFLTEMYYVDDIDNNKLAEEILTSDKKRKSYDPSHTFFEDFHFQDGFESNKLKKIVEDLAEIKGLSLSEMWFHVHLPNESCMPHNHSKSNEISFVYYAKIPKNCGDLYFKNYLFDSPIKQESFESLLILFPSHVEHYVTKNLSTEIRISVAGNFQKKEQL